ncbi:MAG: SCP2 sterol-binding domain-containing protein [Oscillospiraceae bacterium]|nr:SCP2 sterol-binding domain-containing protein [Oscillospiraceae bacterium]
MKGILGMADDVKKGFITPAVPVAVKPAETAAPVAPAVKPAVAKPAEKAPAVKKAVAKKPAVKKATAKPAAAKPAAKKPVAKKAAAKPATKVTAKKATAKPATKVAAKKAAAKPVAKVAAKGGRKKAVPNIDSITTALWKKIGKANVKNMEAPIAIQVIINDLGTFFVAIKDDGDGKKPHIIQAIYDDRDGTLETSYDEMIKIANGKYDFLTAITKGTVRYSGDIRKAIILAGLFK